MKLFKKIDKTLLFLTIVYSILGLVMILSASSASTILRYNKSVNYFFVKQLASLILGYVAGIFIIKFPTKNYKFLVYLATIGIIGLLALLFVNGIVTNNAQSWFRIGSFMIQPSEFAKTVLILFMAVFYNNLAWSNNKNIYLYFVPLAVALIMFFLIAYQPDLGSAFILFVIAFMTFISVPIVSKNILKVFKFIAIGVAILAVGFLYKGQDLITSDKLSRFNFQDPCTRYREETGYQVCNGMIAISNGGLFGVGLGNSTQKYLYLPESHTDFIFPIIVEELGAIVGVGIILGYALLLYRLLRIAKEADNLRTSIIAYGAFWYFAAHVLVNLLGVLALIPLTGVPLPFLSYGGSYTLNAIIVLFCVQRVAIENKKNKFNREMANI